MRQVRKSRAEGERLEHVRQGDSEFLLYRPDVRYPERLHLFYPGGFLPRRIKTLLKNVRTNSN